MRVVSINKYQVLYFDKSTQLIKSEWNEESIKMSLTKFRKEAERIVNFTIKYKPKYVLVDLSNFKYEVNNGDISWFNGIHNIDIADKVGVIISDPNSDLYRSIKVLIDANPVLLKKTNVFNTEFDSFEWLGLNRS